MDYFFLPLPFVSSLLHAPSSHCHRHLSTYSRSHWRSRAVELRGVALIRVFESIYLFANTDRTFVTNLCTPTRLLLNVGSLRKRCPLLARSLRNSVHRYTLIPKSLLYLLPFPSHLSVFARESSCSPFFSRFLLRFLEPSSESGRSIRT